MTLSAETEKNALFEAVPVPKALAKMAVPTIDKVVTDDDETEVKANVSEIGETQHYKVTSIVPIMAAYDSMHPKARGGVFAPLSDETFFRERLTVMNGAVAWDITGTRDATKCVDLDPCVMRDASPVVPDPLRDASA